MSLQNEFLFLLSFLATVSGVFGGEYCYNRLSFSSGQWCTYGCCGYGNTDCCSPNVALIVGLTVLGVLVVSTIIAIVCCCVRRRAAAGTVIRTNPGPGVVVASSQTATQMAVSPGQPMTYQPGYQPAPYAPQPGAYPPQAYPPQAYPMGTQAPPYGYGAPGANPAAGAPTPPPYTQADGGQVNAGYDNKY